MHLAQILRHQAGTPGQLCVKGSEKSAPSPLGLMRDHNPMPAEVVKKGVPILMNKSLPGSGVLPEGHQQISRGR